MTLWNDTVKKTFEEGRLTNPTYQFKEALKDAKKLYNKGAKEKSNVTYRVKKAMKKRKSGSKMSKIPYKKTMKKRK